MNLKLADDGREYIIKSIETDDEELKAFLFSLGCYSGEPIVVIAHLKGSLIVSIKTYSSSLVIFLSSNLSAFSFKISIPL